MTVLGRTRPRRPLGGQVRFRLGRLAGAAAMTVSALFAALPLLFMVNNGLRTDGQIILNPLGLVHAPQFGNLVTAWEGGGMGQSMGRPFFNSLIVTAISVLAVTILATFAGYALGAYRYRGSSTVTQVILMMVAIPTQALIIPVFDMLQNWNLTNNYLGLTFDESCIAEAVSVLEKQGTGTTGSRIANGSYDQHRRLEGIVVIHAARPLDLFRARTIGQPRSDDLFPGLDKTDGDAGPLAQHRVEDVRGQVADRNGIAESAFPCHVPSPISQNAQGESRFPDQWHPSTQAASPSLPKATA